MDENTVLSDDPLQVYLSQVGQIPPLDSAEESTCIDHVRAGDDMAEAGAKRLVEANPFSKRTCGSRSRPHFPLQHYTLPSVCPASSGTLFVTSILVRSRCRPVSSRVRAVP